MTFANKLSRGRLKSRVRGLYGDRPYYYWRSLWDRRVLRDMLQETTVGPQRQFPSRLTLLFISTNRYVEFFLRWHSSLQELFLPGTEKTSFVFTDRINNSCLRAADDVRVIQTTHEPFPYVNLLKFKIINQAATALREFSHIVYVDADIYATSQVTEEEFFHHEGRVSRGVTSGRR